MEAMSLIAVNCLTKVDGDKSLSRVFKYQFSTIFFLIFKGCSSNQFTCSNGQCVPLTTRCNGRNECSDGSDELKCGNVECTTYQLSILSNALVIKRLNAHFSSHNKYLTQQVNKHSSIRFETPQIIVF